MRKVICFHNPDEEYGLFSNWYPSDFTVKGVNFSLMEQYMMYEKARIFEDAEVAAKILKSSDPGRIKALGRSVRNYDDIIWNGVRQIIVYRGLLEKFRQNKELRERLLNTGNAILAECAVQDKIWGIGLSMKDDRRFRLNEWRGQNLLGFSLMRVREELV